MSDDRPKIHPATEALLAFFPVYPHAHMGGGTDLPSAFAGLALAIAANSRGPEGTVALRKLLEAMDAARRDNPGAFHAPSRPEPPFEAADLAAPGSVDQAVIVDVSKAWAAPVCQPADSPDEPIRLWGIKVHGQQSALPGEQRVPVFDVADLERAKRDVWRVPPEGAVVSVPWMDDDQADSDAEVGAAVLADAIDREIVEEVVRGGSKGRVRFLRWADSVAAEDGVIAIPASLRAPPRDDGALSAPRRFMVHGRETIDRIRDRLHAFAADTPIAMLTVEEVGDLLFAGFCLGSEVKYFDRVGLKDGVPPERDLEAAAWYGAFAAHVIGLFHRLAGGAQRPDPRSSRPGGFTPYEVHPWSR